MYEATLSQDFLFDPQTANPSYPSLWQVVRMGEVSKKATY